MESTHSLGAGGSSHLSAAEPLTFGADPLTYQSLSSSPTASSVTGTSPRKRLPGAARSKDKLLSLSSDDDMIDITHQGTVNEVPEEDGLPQSTSYYDSEEIPGIGQYEDFHTIDWQRDIARDRMRHRYIVKKRNESVFDLVKGAHDAWSGWLCVLFVGVTAGSLAGVIDIGASWMTDLKFGICPQAFWLNKEQCCWSSNETESVTANCSQWRSWSEVFGGPHYREGAGAYIISYIMYVLWALFFASMAALLVKMFAPYACGSGIPEVRFWEYSLLVFQA